MPVRQHLEELRGCITRSVVVLGALFLAGMVFYEPLVALMTGPWDAARATVIAKGAKDPGTLIFIRPIEGFLFSAKVALAAALLVGGPYLLWEIWRFVGAGLHAHERRALLATLPFAMLLFAGGLAFGFFVAVPVALPILITWIAPEVAQPTISLQEFLGLLLTFSLVLGFVFELPVLMWLVVRAGLVQAATLSGHRRVAILLIFVVAAVVTPPDPISQVLVALPMLVLYEVGLVLARRAERARTRGIT